MWNKEGLAMAPNFLERPNSAQSAVVPRFAAISARRCRAPSAHLAVARQRLALLAPNIFPLVSTLRHHGDVNREVLPMLAYHTSQGARAHLPLLAFGLERNVLLGCPHALWHP